MKNITVFYPFLFIVLFKVTKWNQKYAKKNIMVPFLKLIFVLMMSFYDKEEVFEIRTLFSLNTI